MRCARCSARTWSRPSSSLTAPTFWTVPDLLMREFPFLKKEIEDEYLSGVEAAANPYPHLFLEGFLLPILTGSRKVAENDRRRAGRILDELLQSPDEDLASAALTSVLELIVGSEQLRDASRPFLGPTAVAWLDRLTR
jgi:hypothetical protein